VRNRNERCQIGGLVVAMRLRWACESGAKAAVVDQEFGIFLKHGEKHVSNGMNDWIAGLMTGARRQSIYPINLLRGLSKKAETHFLCQKPS
jgi:hypothetical protein